MTVKYRLFVDSSNGVDLYPEWDWSEEGRKIEDRHRTRSGREYVYLWGSYDRIKFSVMYVNSATRAIINGWWALNTDLLFMQEGGTDITSGRLVNSRKPIGGKIKPYDDQFKGTIELETY